jgi:hypothetical protein
VGRIKPYPSLPEIGFVPFATIKTAHDSFADQHHLAFLIIPRLPVLLTTRFV